MLVVFLCGKITAFILSGECAARFCLYVSRNNLNSKIVSCLFIFYGDGTALQVKPDYMQFIKQENYVVNEIYFKPSYAKICI